MSKTEQVHKEVNSIIKQEVGVEVNKVNAKEKPCLLIESQRGLRLRRLRISKFLLLARWKWESMDLERGINRHKNSEMKTVFSWKSLNFQWRRVLSALVSQLNHRLTLEIPILWQKLLNFVPTHIWIISFKSQLSSKSK